MRVPTYTAQAKRSTAGGGQFLTAQLSPSVMAAPGKAIADAGNLMVEVGVKKMQIQTQTQVDQAEAVFSQELSLMVEEALKSNDPVGVEQATKDAMQSLLRKYTDGKATDGSGNSLLTGRAARARFMAKGQELVSAHIIDFVGKNNTRIVEADRASLDKSVGNQVDIATNTSMPAESRADAFVTIATGQDSLLAKAKENGTIDDQGFVTRADDAIEQVVRGTALQMFKGAPDATAVALQIANGETDDIIINSALAMMDADDRQKVINDLFTTANKIDTQRREQEEREDKQADAGNQAMFAEIINVDKNDDAAMAGALAKHEALLEANWYEPSERKAAEAVLGLTRDKETSNKIETTREATRVLSNAKVTNTLTADLIEQYSDQLSDSDYEQYYKDLEQENSEGFVRAKGLIRSATRYNEYQDGGILGDVSKSMYDASMLELNTWLSTPKSEGGGQGANFQEIVAKAQQINQEKAEQFTGRMRNALVAYLGNLTSLSDVFGDLVVDANNPVESALAWAQTKRDANGNINDPLIVGMILNLEIYQNAGVQ